MHGEPRVLGEWGTLEWLAVVEQELLLFAGLFFLVGALDELAVDLYWGFLRLTGRSASLQLDREDVRTCLLYTSDAADE